MSSQIEILVLQALLEDASGKGHQAVHTLLSALPEEYCRIYLDEGRVMAELLARCQLEQRNSGGYSPSLEYIERLLEICRQELGIRLLQQGLSLEQQVPKYKTAL